MKLNCGKMWMILGIVSLLLSGYFSEWVFADEKVEPQEAESSALESAAVANGASREACISLEDAKALSEDNRAMTAYLTEIIQAFRTDNTCMGKETIKIDSDGGVSMSQLSGIGATFVKRCSSKAFVAAAASLAAAASEASGSTLPVTLNTMSSHRGEKDIFQVLLNKNKGQPEVDPNLECDEKYSVGPSIISLASFSGTPICFGQARCREKKRGKRLVPIACEAIVSGSAISCPKPSPCLHSRRVNIWARNIPIAK